MSFAIVATVGVGLMGAGMIMQQQNARDAAKAQKEANALALEQSKKTAEQAEQATNRANRKAPDMAAILAGNAMTKGVGSTMLTGPQGVASSNLTLGRSTLLGG